MTLTRTLVEAASWRLASELLRRHPELSIWELHPGGGQYDVLGVRSSRGLRLDLNRAGRIHVHARQDGQPVGVEPFTWERYLETDDPRDFVGQIESASGLARVTDLPPSSPHVLVFRSIAALASASLLVEPLNISMGYLDSSGGSGPAEWWREFAEPAVELTAPRADDPFGEPGYRFWRCRRSDLQLVFEVTQGRVWSASGDELELSDDYVSAGRSMGALTGHLWFFGRL